MPIIKDLEGSTEGWDRSETSNGIPYYVNHQTERTQWDHPLLEQTLEQLDGLNDIKYAAYRMAMKLRAIQKRCDLHFVDLKTVVSIFERHHLRGHRDSVVDVMDLYDIISDIFVMSNKDRPDFIDIELASDLTLNWILNVYDTNRTGCIRIPSVKVGLVVMCSGLLSEKYTYLFQQFSDHSGMMSRKNLSGLLQDMLQMTDQLYERPSFGSVSAAVSSCLEGTLGTGVTEDHFLQWLMAEPQTVVWFPTLHRVASAETVKHQAKCNICKLCPILGFRYRCLKCYNYDLCQNCFFVGRSSRSHKLSHPIQEYCTQTSSKEDAKAFARTVRNNVTKRYKKKRNKSNFLPVHGYREDDTDSLADTQSEADMHGMLGRLATRLADMESSLPPTKVSRPQQTSPKLAQRERPTPPEQVVVNLAPEERLELEDIIQDLEAEKDDLLDDINDLRTQRSEAGSVVHDEQDRLQAQVEVLESHNRQLELQLEKYRLRVQMQERSPAALPAPPPPQPQILSPPYQLQPPLPLPSLSSHPPVYTYPTPSYQSPPHPLALSHPPQQYPSPIRPPPPQYQSTPGQRPCWRPPTFSQQPLREEEYQDEEADQSEDMYQDDDDEDGAYHLGLEATYLPETSHRFPSEEAELEDLVSRVKDAFPKNMSYRDDDSVYSHDVGDEMIAAARKGGEAVTSLVTRIVDTGAGPRHSLLQDDDEDEEEDY
ncbi:dystrophin-like isoform X2 [Branchiostoma lanceolatum]|uniref:dystrophin-like isoform X2 n=1 Tax=Branchiostoma lanceolatum TaxID=7740 RepID=UPI003455CFA6